MKKNSSSPFRLQRSIVDQGGAGGVYEEGGFNPNNVYSDNGISEGIAGFGKIVGAGLLSRTAGDVNDENERKVDRLEKKEERLRTKEGALELGDFSNGTNTSKKQERLNNRVDRVKKRKDKTSAEIKEYEKSLSPFFQKKNTKLTSSDENIFNTKRLSKEKNKEYIKKEVGSKPKRKVGISDMPKEIRIPNKR